MKMTPGPWRYIPPLGDDDFPMVQRGNSGGFSVQSRNREMAMADARLIAAAPDLFHLVLDAIEDADEFETDWNKAARAAIAKVMDSKKSPHTQNAKPA